MTSAPPKYIITHRQIVLWPPCFLKNVVSQYWHSRQLVIKFRLLDTGNFDPRLRWAQGRKTIYAAGSKDNTQTRDSDFLIPYKHQIGHSLYIDTRRLMNASFRPTIESGGAIPYWDQNYEMDFTKSEFPCFFRLTLLQNSRLDIGRTDGLIFIADVVEFPRPKWFTSSIYKFKPK